MARPHIEFIQAQRLDWPPQAAAPLAVAFDPILPNGSSPYLKTEWRPLAAY